MNTDKNTDELWPNSSAGESACPTSRDTLVGGRCFETRGHSVSTGRAGFSGGHPTISVQSVLRSGHHRFSVREDRTPAAGAAHRIAAREPRGAPLRGNRRQESPTGVHDAPGGGARSGASRGFRRTGFGGHAVLAPVYGRGDSRHGAACAGGDRSAAALPAVFQDHYGKQSQRMVAAFSSERLEPDSPYDRAVL